MKIEIENVIAADDVASKMVEGARAEAGNIRAVARETSERIIAHEARELASAFGAEQLRILSEAEANAARILKEADSYIERIRGRKETVLQELVERLKRKVTGV
jgi:vacuolar-type H+-ATPase subunit E/Vma4